MKNNSHERGRMRRKWIEGAIMGALIGLTAVLLQALFGGAGTLVRLLALLAAGLLICAVQFALSTWDKPRP
jgi:hypothetical protein